MFSSNMVTTSILDLLLGILILVLMLLYASKRHKKEAPVSLDEFKLKTRKTPHRLVLPGVIKYEQGYVEVAKTPSFFAVESEVRVRWLSRGSTIEGDYVDVDILCEKPPLVVKKALSLHVIMPAIRVKTGKYRDLVVACFNTEHLNATGYVYEVFEDGFARGYVRIADGLFTATLETSRIPLEEMGRTPVTRLELCSKEVSSTCIKLLESRKPGVVELKLNYPLVKTLVFGYADRGFEEAFKLAESIPCTIIGPALYMKIVVERGFTRKRIATSELTYLG